MNNNETQAIDNIISEFENNFDGDTHFNSKVSNHLDSHDDDWADILEAKDDLDDAIMSGASANDEKKTLANAFAAVAEKVFSKDELKASFPDTIKTLSKVDASALGSDVEKLSVALDL